jgi:hypothetical protein
VVVRRRAWCLHRRRLRVPEQVVIECLLEDRWVDQTDDVVDRLQAGGIDHGLQTAPCRDGSSGCPVVLAVPIRPRQRRGSLVLVQPGLVRVAGTAASDTYPRAARGRPPSTVPLPRCVRWRTAGSFSPTRPAPTGPTGHRRRRRLDDSRSGGRPRPRPPLQQVRTTRLGGRRLSDPGPAPHNADQPPPNTSTSAQATHDAA